MLLLAQQAQIGKRPFWAPHSWVPAPLHLHLSAQPCDRWTGAVIAAWAPSWRQLAPTCRAQPGTGESGATLAHFSTLFHVQLKTKLSVINKTWEIWETRFAKMLFWQMKTVPLPKSSLLFSPSPPTPPPWNQWCAVKLKNSVQEESEVQRELWFSVCYTTNARHAINKLMTLSKKNLVSLIFFSCCLGNNKQAGLNKTKQPPTKKFCEEIIILFL